MDEVLDSLIHVLTITAAVASVLFVLTYLRSPWRKNVTGRNTMAFMAVVAAALTTAVVFRQLDEPLPKWLSVVIWGMINWPLWWRAWILWKVQHQPYTPAVHACTACGQPCSG